MKTQRWFYKLLMEEFGPTSAKEIQRLVEIQRLGIRDRVRPESSADWMLVSDFLQQLASTSALNSPVNVEVPSEEERQMELDISSFNLQGNVESVDPGFALNIDSFNLQGNSDPDVNENFAALDINSFNLHGNNDSPLPVRRNTRKLGSTTRQAADDVNEDVTNFFVRSIGHVLGPLTRAEIIDMAGAGSLTHGDEIREGPAGKWIALDAMPGMAGEAAAKDLSSRRATPAASSSAADSDASAKSKTSKKKARRSTSNRKKKRKPKKDEFLQEIFAELFADDGQLRHERKSSVDGATVTGPSNAALQNNVSPSDVQSGRASAASSEDQDVSMDNGQPMQLVARVSPVNDPAAAAVVAGAQSSSFSRAQTPFRPTSPSFRSRGGLTLPRPKTLAMLGGGLLAVILLAGMFTGDVPLLSFGVDGKSFCNEFAEGYVSASTGDETTWNAFRVKYNTLGRRIVRDLAPHVSNDPAAKRDQQAVLLIMKLTGLEHSMTAEREVVFGDFLKMTKSY